MMYGNRAPLWNKNNEVPSGWGHVEPPSTLQKIGKYFYNKIQFMDSVKPGSQTLNGKNINKEKDAAPVNMNA